jgi:hypothetical protein
LLSKVAVVYTTCCCALGVAGVHVKFHYWANSIGSTRTGSITVKKCVTNARVLAGAVCGCIMNAFAEHWPGWERGGTHAIQHSVALASRCHK